MRASVWAGALHSYKVRAGPQKTNPVMRGLQLWVCPASRERWGVRDNVQFYGQGLNQSCLHNETPVKTLSTVTQWSFLNIRQTFQCISKVTYPVSVEKEASVLGTLQVLALGTLHLVVYIIYDETFIIKVQQSPKFPELFLANY